jgi:Amt family ammonium transporter
LLYGNPGQLTAQLIAIVVVGLYSFVGSYVILKIIEIVTPLRVTPEEEVAGLDMSQHGEHAYALD